MLVDDLKRLEFEIKQWRHKVFDYIEQYVPKKDDGTSTYWMLMKDLNNLKECLPPEYAFQKLLYIVKLIVN